ncbi:pleiotropic regulator 1-like [Cotesia glomerata]|uniref:Pleiotropic regulator 1 n=1 Tax=Cotesia glomerata TaxID=32391 RepID=A0AAV7IMC3_COTGL|nr:pleiotropic regulator 1-like [Cotesia glomerata]KAH0564212.1 Pleiotropic regulator 1 [Cotesia glomerata]
MVNDVDKHSVHTLVFRSLKRTHDAFLKNKGLLPPVDPKSYESIKRIKARSQYGDIVSKVKSQPPVPKKPENNNGEPLPPGDDSYVDTQNTSALVSTNSSGPLVAPATKSSNTVAIPRRQAPVSLKPKWHAPWKLYRVISGHLGWVRCCAVEPENRWFATGAGDRIIKIWDLAKGSLMISLTGHISTVRGLAFSHRHPYLFSCGEDKQVKCWDLETNKVIRHYHGHLSAVYSMALHPTLDILTTAGRDSTARVWDMRTKANVHTLVGHTNTVASVVSQAAEPQIITGSHDSTIRLWDLAAGKSMATLTHHKKSVRALCLHSTRYMFASGAPDNIKTWKCPEGKFIQNLSGHNAIINCLAVNADGVMVSGADCGSMNMWDFHTGYNFQRLTPPVQPGSMDSEAGLFSATFDMSGSRLIMTGADKTIKLFKECEDATEESHPINWKPEIIRRKKF